MLCECYEKPFHCYLHPAEPSGESSKQSVGMRKLWECHKKKYWGLTHTKIWTCAWSKIKLLIVSHRFSMRLATKSLCNHHNIFFLRSSLIIPLYQCVHFSICLSSFRDIAWIWPESGDDTPSIPLVRGNYANVMRMLCEISWCPMTRKSILKAAQAWGALNDFFNF